MTRFAISIGAEESKLPAFEEYRLAVWAAVDHARAGEIVTLLQVDGPDDQPVFTPLCVVSPPEAT